MGRSPCGERGLKYRPAHGVVVVGVGSLPVRGAWVEMFMFVSFPGVCPCRSPCGERGLKFPVPAGSAAAPEVAPRAGSVG